MKVYIITKTDSYDETIEILAVTGNVKLAKRLAAIHDGDIEEWDTDEFDQEYVDSFARVYRVRRLTDGRLDIVGKPKYYAKTGVHGMNFIYELHGHNRFTNENITRHEVNVFADSTEEALAIARKKFDAYFAEKNNQS